MDRIELSSPLAKFVNKQYPHLTDEDIQVLFRSAELGVKKNDVLNVELIPKQKRFFQFADCIQFSKSIARMLKVDDEIPLIRDEEGTAWRVFVD